MLAGQVDAADKVCDGSGRGGDRVAGVACVQTGSDTPDVLSLGCKGESEREARQRRGSGGHFQQTCAQLMFEHLYAF